LLRVFSGMWESEFDTLFVNLNSALRNVLGANFALVGAPSLGASGAIFGTLAVCEAAIMSGLTF
jgi:membrane associated rhomboid family serine protease